MTYQGPWNLIPRTEAFREEIMELYDLPDWLREKWRTPSVTCPRCGMTSYNGNDIEQGFCGKCCDWTSAQ